MPGFAWRRRRDSGAAQALHHLRATGPVPYHPLWILLLALLLSQVAFLPAQTSSPASGTVVWIAGQHDILHLDATSGEILFRIPDATGVRALAVDPVRGTLWAYGAGRLTAYGPDGGLLLSLAPGGDPNAESAQLLVDGVDGGVWLATDRQLLRFTAGGAPEFSLMLDDAVTAIALDRGRRHLWVAHAPESLTAYDPGGGIAASLEAAGISTVSALAHDAGLDALWVAGIDRLQRYDATGMRQFEQAVSGLTHLAADGQGALWGATSKQLLYLHPSGLVFFELQPFDGRATIIDLIVDRGDRSVWVATVQEAARVTAQGEIPHHLNFRGPDHPGRLRVLALQAPQQAPRLSILAPGQDSFHASHRPELRFRFETAGSGLDPDSLEVRIDDEVVAVDCTFSADEALCHPLAPLPEGLRRLRVTVADTSGNHSEPAEVQFTVDTTPPLITLDTPVDGTWTNIAMLTVAGRIDEAANLTIDGLAVGLDAELRFSHSLDLVEGSNDIEIVATDLAGNGALEMRTVHLDTVAPAKPDAQKIRIGEPIDGQASVSGDPGAVESGTRVEIINLDSGESVTVEAMADGSFAAVVGAVPGNRLAVTVVDRAGNGSMAWETIVPDADPDPLPPDPATVAPPLDPTVATTMFAATGFLYSGPNPIQQGVAPGTIEERRVAVIRGQVKTRGGAPLSGVRVTIKDHGEYGHTLSRTDGLFDLAVNGGGWITVRYERDGYLPVQRQVKAPWQDYAWLPDVVMVGLDPQVTRIDLAANTPIQTARGGSVTDSDGTRQATVLFPQGTQAELVLPDGTTQPLGTLNVRATEYTVGESGPAAMPGELPPTSGYTYAVELSVDEAIAAGAKEVRFDRPVPFYLENFLDFPVGGIVPAGWYDRERAAWIPSDNGRIIQILSINDGMAALDVDGSGNPAEAAALEELGISEDERRELALLYTPGKSLWRVPMEHFTPWDCNWPFGPPNGASGPSVPEPMADNLEDEPDEECGSIIECQSQVLGKRVPVTGTPFTLNYRSSRVPGRMGAYSLNIPLSGTTTPIGLKRIDLEITVSGQKFTQSFQALPDQTHKFIWDGSDVYGRTVQGPQIAIVRLGYVYTGVYYQSAEFDRSFAQAGSGDIAGDRYRNEITIWKTTELMIGARMDARSIGLGGWTISPHNIYMQSHRGNTLCLGDGMCRSASAMGKVVKTVAGNGCTVTEISGEGGQAIDARFSSPSDVALTPDGSLYIAHAFFISKVGTDGIITIVAGNGNPGFSGDGGPATGAMLNGVNRLAYGPDGSLFISESNNSRIRRIGSDGVISTVAGDGTSGFKGDGGLAINASIGYPIGLAVSPDGSLYIAAGARIRKVDPNGIITTVAGTGIQGTSGDGGPAIDARIHTPNYVSLGPDGSIYIADYGSHRIRRVDTSGIITTVAGIGSRGDTGDGGQATSARLENPRSVIAGQDGSLYIATYGSHRIRQVSPDGVISAFAGGGSTSSDGVPALMARLHDISGMSFGSDGGVYIAEFGNCRVRRVSEPFSVTAMSGNSIPSPNTSALFIFDLNGRHNSTLDNITGDQQYKFGYDKNGYLSSVVDGDENATHVERDPNSNPIAITSSSGQRTEFTLDSNGYLATITNPAGETHNMAYTDGGLLIEYTDPRDNISRYHYDDLGRLIQTGNAAGGGWNLSRTSLANGHETSMTSAEGRTTRYRVERLPTGEKLRTNIHPDDTMEVTRYGTGGQRTVTVPDGTTTELVQGPDPRFGMNSPVPKLWTISTPAGQVLQTSTERTAILADSGDLLSHSELTETVSRNGRVSTSRYTAVDRAWRRTSPVGRELTLVLDERGRVTQQVQAGLAPMTYAYDARGRLEEMIQAPNTPQERRFGLGYDDDGWLASVTDPLSRTLAYEYDAAGRLIRQTLPDGRAIGYQYDPNGNLIALLPPGREAHLFSYTSVNLEEQYTPPDLSGAETITRYRYNLDKQLTRIERPDGKAVALGYDLGGRLDRMTLARGQYRHDYHSTTGQPVGITAPDGGTLAFGWDGFLPVSETWGGEISGTLLRDYDNDFRLTGLDVDGESIVFGYDDDGLLTNAGVMSITRNPQHGLPTGTLLGAMATTRDHNEFGVPTRDSAAMDNDTLLDITYTRDRIGRVEEITEMIDGVTTVHAYGYDLTGRLVTATRDGVTTTWAYDSNGNRTHVNGTQVASYDGQDRLLSYATASYAYTANGELTSKTEGGATTRYDYDELGNLLQVTLPGDITLDYLVDGRNRRIGKKVNGTLVQGFLYQDQLNPVAELDGEGNVIARFVYADKPNVPAYMIRDGIRYRILSDQLGSPRLVVNTDSGEIAQRLDYDVWGNILLDTNPGFQPFGFAGGIYDQHTGLVRFGARDYDPNTGRWVSKDPIRFNGNDTNIYAYVNNDPVNMIDPTGLYCLPQSVINGVSGFVGGFVGGFAQGLLMGNPAAGLIGGLAAGVVGGALGAALSPTGTVSAGYAGALGAGIASPTNASIAGGGIGGAVSYAAGASGAPPGVAGAVGGLSGGAASGFFGVPGAASWATAGAAAKNASVAGMLGGALGGLTQQLLQAGQDCECNK